MDIPYWTFNLPISGNKYLHITNPFRGIFITGGAGAGKSQSVVEPLIYQAVEKKIQFRQKLKIFKKAESEYRSPTASFIVGGIS